MSSHHVVSVGFRFPGNNFEFVSFNEPRSLADADIIIFSPDVSTELYSDFEGSLLESVSYKGLPRINNKDGFDLVKHTKFWSQEIQDALDSGKTVFVFLAEPQDFWVPTGKKRKSGTGKSQKVTDIVTSYNSYSVFPVDIGEPRLAKGEKFNFSDPSSVLTGFWSEFGHLFNYEVILENFEGRTNFFQRSTGKTLGGQIKCGNGNLVLFPCMSVDDTDLIEHVRIGDGDHEVEAQWNKDGVIFGKKFISELIKIQKALSGIEDQGTVPEWVSFDSYEVPRVIEITKKIQTIENQLVDLEHAKRFSLEELKNANLPKLLLYGTGKPLEDAVKVVMKCLGFDVSSFRNEHSEFDIILVSDEGRALGEIEGKDSKPIDVKKYSQLLRNIMEDFERDEVSSQSKGILFGNGFRFTNPLERAIQFTEKCIVASKNNNIALVQTCDLFEVFQYLSLKEDQIFAKKCRAEIFNSSGLVNFPRPPQK